MEAHNVMMNSSSEQIQRKWKDSSENRYSLRSVFTNDVKVPEKPVAKCLGFSYNGAKLFNILPRNIRETPNPNNFKTLTKDWIWKNIPSQ